MVSERSLLFIQDIESFFFLFQDKEHFSSFKKVELKILNTRDKTEEDSAVSYPQEQEQL
jgi:hypothetical protein